MASGFFFGGPYWTIRFKMVGNCGLLLCRRQENIFKL